MSISDVRKRIAEEEKRRSTSSLANAQQNDSVHDRVAKIKSAATLYDAEDIGYGTDERISHVNKNLYQPNNQRDMRLTAQGLAHLGKRAGSVINTLGIYSDHFGEAGKIAQERAGVANSPAAKQAQAMARARSGDMNVLSGLDEDDPNYALYKRLLRLSGYDDVTRAYGATELPEELTREGVSTYADLFGRQRDYDSNQMGRDLQDVEFLSQGAGDSQRYLDASGRLQDYFGGDWSADAVNERMQSGGAGWYQELLKQYGLDTQALRDAYPLDDKDHDYDGYVRYMQDLAKQKQEQDAMLARYNEWKAYYDGKWGGLSSEPDYAQYTGEIVDPATYYPQQMMPETLVAGYDYMTDEEKRNFTYLLKNPAYDDAGDDGAEQYLKDLQEELWRRRITAKNENLAEFTDKNALTGALGWVGARVSNLANAAMGAGNAISAPLHAMFGEEISPYDPSFDYARYTQTADTVNAQNINEATQWAQIGRFNPFNIAYSGASAAADSILSGLAFGPGGGAAAQAFGAGNAELMQGIEAGDRPFADVVMDAFATGAFEGLTEKFSIDALFKGGTSAAKNIARSMLTEPSEEIANMLLNLGYERLRYGTDDDLGRRMSELVTQGYTESEARVQLLKELGADALETVLTAMVAGGAGGGASAVSTSVENRSIGKSIQANEATSRLLEIAEGMGDFPNDVRALIEDQKAALQAAQEAQRISETQSEETVEEEPEASDAAREVAQEEAAEEAAPKKPDTKKKKTPQLNNAKLGRIYRETMSRLDEQAQALLEGSFAETSVRKSLERFAFLDTDSKGQVVRRDKPMQQMLERAATKAIYSAESLTDQEKSVLRGSKAALRTVGEFTGIVARDGSSERERIRSAAEELYSLTQSKSKPDAENAEDAETLATAAPDDVSVTVEEAGELSPAEAAQVVEEYASGYGGNADIVTGAYEQGQNVAEFASAFRTAYEYGQDGRNLEIIKTSSALAVLNDNQIRTAYELGRDARKMATKLGRKQNRAIFVGNFDTSALKGMKLNGTQQKSVGAIRKLAEIVGFNVEFIASAPNAEGKYTAKNGSWNSSTRTMTVDINAGRISAGDANYAMMQTVGHELTHYIADFADSELFNDYQEFVFGHLSEKMDEDVLNDRIQKIIEGNARQGKTLTREQAAIEVVADASGDALLSLTEADIRDLAQTNRPLLWKIADYIQKWTKKVVELIRKAYDGQGRNQIAEQMVDVAEEMGRKWVALLKNANARVEESTGELLVTTEQGAAATTDDASSIEAESEPLFLAYNHIDQRTAETVRSVDTQLFCSEVEEATLYYAAAANMLLHDVEGSVSGQKFFVEDGEVTGQKRMTSDFIAGVKDSTGWTWDKIRNSLEQFAAMESGEQLPKNTVTNREMEMYLDEVLSNGYTNTDGVKVAPADDYVAAKAQYRGSAGNAAPRSAYEGAVDFMEYAFGDVAYSVREGAVGVNSAAFRKWFKDSKVVNHDGSPKVMYHGSPNTFTVFDKRKARSSGLYGRGFYFTDSASHGSAYGSLYQVYLSIQNPLTPGGSSVTRSQVRKFLEAVAENEDDYSIENYGTYDVGEILKSVYRKDAFAVIQDVNATAIGDMVEAVKLFNEVNGTDYDGIVVDTETVAFEPNQIKSATDNDGAFDPESDDIRYSVRDTDTHIKNITNDTMGRRIIAESQSVGDNVSISDFASDVNQLRDPDLISDREILANVMESAATNAEELDHVRRYRKRIAALNELQTQLDETNAALADARKRGAKKEQAALMEKANGIARKLDREDGMLLKYESGKLLQAVVKRQREQLRRELNRKASQRAQKRMKEVRQQDREHYEERIRKLRAEKNAKLDEMRREKTDAVAKVRAEKNESFAKAQYLGEVQKHSKRLMDLLTTPTNKAYVPEFLRRPLADFITALDFRSVTQLEGGEATKGDERMKDAMAELSSALRKAHTQQFGENTTGAEFFSGYLDLPGDFLDNFDELMRKIRLSLSMSSDFAATPVNKMKSEQLHELAKAFRLLHSSISNMNRLIANAKYASAVNAANDTMAELDGLRAKNDQNALLDKVSSFLDWKNTVPYYVFQRFGKGGKAIFEGLMDGWDQLARNSDELVKFANSAYETKEVREWDRQIQTVKLDSGTEIRMTTAQMMSVYCLAKREQARGHLLGGGIRVADITGRGGKLIRQADNHLLTDDDIKRIAGMLTERQREVADKLQKHMSTRGSEWGNYVSMKRFGYEMFTEENYFPIETDPNNRKAQDEKSEGESLYRLLNMSATKGLVRNANNAIVIRGIFDVYTAHMSDMAKYNALGLQLLDTFKWFNYVERTQNKDGTVETRSVQKSLEAAYGGDARSYVLQFLRDLNGTNEGGREDGVIKRAISNYKIASVAANLRVGILQITSLPRAAYAIDPKYLAIGIAKWNAGKGKNSRRAYDEVGIAKWKELGFYDTNISRSIRQMVKHDETVVDVVRDKSMKLAEWGDAWTLGVLYGAVEAEMKDRYPSAKPGTDAYKTLLNRRMREIIYQTQVVDSTMTRSQLMRDTRSLMQLATSFMSEPTLAMNMLNDAIFEARMKARSGAKDWLPAAMPKVAKAFGATAFVIGMSSLVEALMTAYRDDDEFEKFSEKMRKAFFGENFWDGSLGGNLNLLNNLPVVKDIVSAAQGNSTDVMYNAWVKTLGDGVQTLYKVILDGGSSADIYRGVYKTVNGLSQFTGIAVGAAMREFVAAYNTFGADRITKKRLQTYDNTAKDAARAIYAASMRGDKDMVKFYRERAAMYGIDESKISKALATLIEEELKAGNIDAATASKLLTGEAGKSADYTSDLINDAQYELDTGLDFDNLRDDYAAGVLSESQVRNYLVKYGGKSTEEIEDTMSRYDYYIATGKTTTPPKYWRIAYAHETGGNYRRLAEDAMVSIIAGGRTEKQARRQIADSLESYYKDEYLSIAGTPAGDRMLEDILDVYEAIGFTREYERNYIAENWFD